MTSVEAAHLRRSTSLKKEKKGGEKEERYHWRKERRVTTRNDFKVQNKRASIINIFLSPARKQDNSKLPPLPPASSNDGKNRDPKKKLFKAIPRLWYFFDHPPSTSVRSTCTSTLTVHSRWESFSLSSGFVRVLVLFSQLSQSFFSKVRKIQKIFSNCTAMILYERNENWLRNPSKTSGWVIVRKFP